MSPYNHHAYCVAGCYGGCEHCGCHTLASATPDRPVDGLEPVVAPSIGQRLASVASSLWESWVRYSELAGPYHGIYPM